MEKVTESDTNVRSKGACKFFMPSAKRERGGMVHRMHTDPHDSMARMPCSSFGKLLDAVFHWEGASRSLFDVSAAFFHLAAPPPAVVNTTQHQFITRR